MEEYAMTKRLGLGLGVTTISAVRPSNVYSLAFDGSDEYLSINTTDHQIDEGTISLWAKTTNTGTMGSMFAGSDASDPSSDLTISKSSSDKLWVFVRDNDNMALGWTSDDDLSVDTWYHIVFVVGSSSNAIYVNGSLPAGDYQGDNDNTTQAWFSDVADIDTLLIGAREHNGGIEIPWQGNIDEVAYWNKALSAGDISALYQAKGTVDLKSDGNSANLKGWWRMGDGRLDSYPLIADEVNPTLGSEALGDPTFDDDATQSSAGTHWTMTAVGEGETLEVTGGKLVVADAVEVNLWDSGAMTSGKVYKFQITLDSYSSGRLRGAGHTGSWYLTPTGTGTYTQYFTSSGTEYRLLIDNTANFTATDISVKPVNGNPGLMISMAADDFETKSQDSGNVPL